MKEKNRTLSLLSADEAVASQSSWGPFDRFGLGGPPLDPKLLK